MSVTPQNLKSLKFKRGIKGNPATIGDLAVIMQDLIETAETIEEIPTPEPAPPATTTETDIEAFAGGGQTNATQLTATFNKVTVVATGGDSIKLPAAIVNAHCHIINADDNSMDVFPQSGEQYEGSDPDLAEAITAGTTLEVHCYETGVWTSI